LKSSPLIEQILEQYRQHIPFINNDTIMYEKMQYSVDFVQELEEWFEFE